MTAIIERFFNPAYGWLNIAETLAGSTEQYATGVPASAGDVSPLSYVQSTGVKTVDFAAAFNGDNLSYSITTNPDATNITINSVTGIVSIDTGATGLIASQTLTITASNQLGSATASTTISVTAADEVGPSLTGTTVNGATDTATVNSNEAGVMYWMVDANLTRTAAQVEAGGGEASGSFSVAASTTTNQAADLTSSADGDYSLHLMEKDAAGNQSNVASSRFTLTK